jgi:hypothetical protein
MKEKKYIGGNLQILKISSKFQFFYIKFDYYQCHHYPFFLVNYMGVEIAQKKEC